MLCGSFVIWCGFTLRDEVWSLCYVVPSLVWCSFISMFWSDLIMCCGLVIMWLVVSLGVVVPLLCGFAIVWRLHHCVMRFYFLLPVSNIIPRDPLIFKNPLRQFLSYWPSACASKVTRWWENRTLICQACLKSCIVNAVFIQMIKVNYYYNHFFWV